MNFKFTLKTTAIFFVALIVSGVIGVLLDSKMTSLVIMIAVVWYLAEEEKRRKDRL